MADIKIDTAVAIIEPDVESSLEPSVHKENNTIIDDDVIMDETISWNMVGMGIAMFILILVGTVSSFFIPYLNSACYFAVILTCECYYTKKYYNLNEEPHVNKRLATSTLITIILLFILLSCETPVFYLDETTVGTTFISSDAQIKVPFYISLVLIYCGIFTWYCPLRRIFIIVLCTCHFVVRIVD